MNGSSIGRTSHVEGDYFLQDGYLFKGRQLCILAGSMRENIIQEFHSGAMVGNFGKEKIIHLVIDKFYWPKIKRYITKYVAGCILCQILRDIHTI